MNLFRKNCACGIVVAAVHSALSVVMANAAVPASNSRVRIDIEPQTLEFPGQKTLDYELGTLHVPENRNDPRSRLIRVGFARFRALAKSDSPPTFHLPGGPGSSLLTGLRFNQSRLSQIAFYRQAGDVVLVDQRGFSERGEMLRFKHQTAGKPFDRPADLAHATAEFVRTSEAAAAHFAARGVDLRGYNVLECADDVDDLRRLLGYERITLVGTSFGSQWSFAVMRRHPETVARALLSGIEPLDNGYDMPSHIFAAVRRIWYDAERDPQLKPYLPPGGLHEAAKAVFDRLDKSPVRVPIKSGNIETTIVLGRGDFQRHAFLRGYDGPAFILAAYYEHYDDWAAEVAADRRGQESAPAIIGPLIDTSLGVTPGREFLLRTDPATEFLGQWNFDAYLASADAWPSPDVGDAFRTPDVSKIPVVFVHGDWDTQTPLENATGAIPYFPNGRLVIVERGGHGALGQVYDRLPAVRNALLEFVRTGDATKLPARVTLSPPKFPVPPFAPPN